VNKLSIRWERTQLAHAASRTTSHTDHCGKGVIQVVYLDHWDGPSALGWVCCGCCSIVCGLKPAIGPKR
jgi:hypothetical protein